ncbi:AAA family ATPase [Streptomyces genisteinicus]|uniref:ATP-binding protein n=1 Tax=Streptomyces genisteinicus TaxID=2768068 RepID=A0A7H0HML8_9ACTN|nr:ATP-binding protein [Streptomyces genisteinicus]QNP61784.1 ATP-binding protein [Streptomyces genisteinicus]
MTERRLTADRIRALLTAPAGGRADAPEEVAPARWAYREAAALLGAFTGEALLAGAADRSVSDGGDPALRETLAYDCDPVSTREGRRWRLTPQVRAAALERLRTPERMLRAVRGVPGDPADTARAWAERLLRGQARDLAKYGVDELHAALTVTQWFAAAPLARSALSRSALELPEPAEVRERIELAELLAPLRALVEDRFVGRRAELDMLAAHVGVLPGRGGAPGPAPAERPRLMIHGPGGVGKSTLIARFVLDHAGEPGAPVLPFAYLSFDRADLLPQQPLTLLAEAARQLGLRHPGLAPAAAELGDAVRRTLLADHRSSSETASTRTGGRRGHALDERRLAELFARLATSAAEEVGGAPVLLVLDTVEQAQRQGGSAMSRLTEFLDVLQSVCPRLRVVLAGRAPLDDASRSAYGTGSFELGGFDHGLALAFLRHRTGGEEAVGGDFLAGVIRRFGTNPLSLKLVAEVIRQEGPGALDDPASRRRLSLLMEPEQLQGALYQRILDHLGDPALRRIASPGLTVRRVTPDVIREVLAGPCGLGEVDPVRAHDLFRMLRSEASLVEDVPGRQAVVHRPDVRRAMLLLLRRDDPQLMRRIDLAAVSYYRRLPETDPLLTAEHRAEELYHRMALDQSATTLDGRWLDAAAPLLESALDELPPRAQVYLSDRLGITVAPALRAQADGVTWARQVETEAGRLLDAGHPDRALALLSERTGEHTATVALTLLRLRALAALGLVDEARPLVEPALDRASQESAAAFVEIALLGARLEEDTGRYGVSHDLLLEARRAAGTRQDGTALLRVDTARLRLYRRTGTADVPDALALREDVLARLRGWNTRSLERHPTLVRDLAAELGDALPRLVPLAARLLGVDLDSGTGRVLEDRLSTDDIEDFTRLTDPVPPPDAADTPLVRLRNQLPAVNTVARGDLVSEYLLSGAARQDAWRDALVEAYRHEADQPDRSGPPAPGGRPAFTRDAVVVVPGFMGSELLDTRSERLVWGQDPGDQPAAWRGQEHPALRVTDEDRDGTGRLRAVRLLRQPAWAPWFGGTEAYTPLLETVLSRVVHPDAVLEFAYDWRLPAARNAALLAEAAQRHLAAWRQSLQRAGTGGSGTSRPPRLVFVAHGMGGLIARAALARTPGLADGTRALVSIGTPFQGSVAVAAVLGARRPRHGTARRFRRALLHLPGVYDMLPAFPCVERGGAPERLTPADLADVGADRELAASAMEFQRAVRGAPTRLPAHRGVAGIGQPTPQGLRITDGEAVALHSALRTRTNGDLLRLADGTAVRWDRSGDGLVSRDAAALGGAAPELCHVTARHGSTATHPVTLRYVAAVLTEQPGDPVAPESVGAVLPRTVETTARGRTGAAPSGRAIGLAAGGSNGIGLVVPDTVTTGEPWLLRITGTDGLAGLGCTITDVATGRPVLEPGLRPDGDGVTGTVTLPWSGLHRITVTREGAPPVTELTLAAAP